MRRFGQRRHREPDNPGWRKFFSSDEKKEEAVLEESLADIGLSVRNLNTLEDAGILSVKDLASTSRDELLAIDNIGDSAVQECADALKKLGVVHPNWRKPKKKRTARRKVKKKSTREPGKKSSKGGSCARADARRVSRRAGSQR